MSRLLASAVALVALVPASASAATGPRVETMVVARSGAVTFGPRPVLAAATTIAAGRRRCRVAAGTPAAALAAARRDGGPSFAAVDLAGSCSPRHADGSAGLFVRRIGADRNRGESGWVYKVGSRAGTAGAGDPAGPFGAGRLRSGARVVWYWCRVALACQRTLALTPSARALPGGRPLSLIVRAYDDAGRGRRVARAVVRLGGARALSGPDGRATLLAPATPGRYRVTAAGRGLVPAFPETVVVG